MDYKSSFKSHHQPWTLILKPILAYLTAQDQIWWRVQSWSLRIITLPPPGTSNEIILVGLGMQRLLDNNNQSDQTKNPN